nr:MAG TPA_asm: hypothetical protein [Caudoviricetes sp.]
MLVPDYFKSLTVTIACSFPVIVRSTAYAL